MVFITERILLRTPEYLACLVEVGSHTRPLRLTPH